MVSPVVRFYTIQKEKRSETIGFFKADCLLLGGYRFSAREFIKLMHTSPVRYMYAYHLQDKKNKLVFRYDNVEHYPGMKNFPHHKHTASRVVSSRAPQLSEVIKEIETLVGKNK